MLYAAYGSNLHPVRLSLRVPSARLLGTALLPEWSLHFHKRGSDESGKCNILASGDGVFFAVFDIDAREQSDLDVIEGHGYEASEIAIPAFGDCYTYIATESHVDDNLAPFSWYKALVLSGLEYHAAPAGYIARVRAVQETEDADPDRHAANSAILSQMGRPISPGF